MDASTTDLFAEEHAALSVARSVYEDRAASALVCRHALGALALQYERLLRETRRLIRRSDREELEMNQLNQRLNELAGELAYRASHDPLTGALNRAAVIDAANQILSTQALALIVLDIDHFKQVNDSFGHPAGDAVIRSVVACLRRRLPESARLGRVGGEEFTVLLAQTDEMCALRVAEAMRTEVAAHDFGLPGAWRVSASFGVSWTAAGHDFDFAYGRADAALYEAKRGGRNRVERSADVAGL